MTDAPTPTNEPQGQNINVNDSTIQGGIVGVGGTMEFHERVYVGNITQIERQRTCPKPPAEPDHFGGRDAPLAELAARLKAGQTSAITAVHGLGGIGKTTLAKKVANDLHRDKTFRAVLWANVTRNPNAVTLLTDWAQYADPTFSSGDVPLEQIVIRVKGMLEDVIGEKCERCEPPRVLVVLDDVWDNGLDTARRLREACPSGATVLITTRSENLAIDLGATSQALDRLRGAEGVQMLQSYEQLATLDPAALLTLVDALGGHPLALTLAARRVQKAANKAKALADHTASYREGVPAGAEFADLKLDMGETREDSLTLALSFSYDDLNEDDRQRFRALGLLAYNEPFDLPTLAALWGVEPSAAEEHANTLRLLSLIELDSSYGEGWYRQHPLLRTYARALLKQDDCVVEREAAFGRYANYVIEIVEGFRRLPPEEWEQLTPYLPHMRAVGDGLTGKAKMLTKADLDVSGPHCTTDIKKTEEALRQAQRFAVNTSRYLFYRREEHHIDWMEMGLVVSRELADQKEEARFLNELGGSYSALGQKQRALEYYEQALPLDLALGDQRELAATYNNIGLVYSDLGEKQRALEYYEQALPLLRTVGDQREEATTLNNIGRVYDTIGEKRRALDHYAQALPMFRVLGDTNGEAATLNNVGMICYALGEKQRALSYYKQALPLLRAVGNRVGEANVLNNIALFYSDLGEKQQALDYFKQALSLMQIVGDRRGQANKLNNIGALYSDLGKKQQALDYYEKALPLWRTVGDRAGEASTLNNIGLLYFDLGKITLALDYLEQALPLRRIVGDRIGEATTCFNIGMVYENQGDLDQAIHFVARTVQLDEEIERPNLERDRGTLARLLQQRDGGPRKVSNMPPKQIDLLREGTVAAKTSLTPRLAQIREAMRRFRDEAAGMGVDWQIEVAFAEALLAVLDDQPASLPDDNPYQSHLQRVLDEISKAKGHKYGRQQR